MLCVVMLSCIHVCVTAQSYQPVDAGSSVKAVIRNFGMDVDARFTGVEGSILFNPSDLKSARFAVSIDGRTVSTGIDVRDSALRGQEYLGTDISPSISFTSKQITQPVKGGPYMMKGTVTIKGISKDINFPFTVTPKDDGILFSGQMRLNRLDFKIAPSSTVLSNSLIVYLSIFAKRS